MFTGKTVQTVLTDKRFPMVFTSTSNQTRKVADEDVVMYISFVVGQQQQVDEVFPLSVGCDIERDGLTLVKCHHVDADVRVQSFAFGSR